MIVLVLLSLHPSPTSIFFSYFTFPGSLCQIFSHILAIFILLSPNSNLIKFRHDQERQLYLQAIQLCVIQFLIQTSHFFNIYMNRFDKYIIGTPTRMNYSLIFQHQAGEVMKKKAPNCGQTATKDFSTIFHSIRCPNR